ncbi:MAG: DNA polymerase III subunit delta' [Elainellaceae cyanobacterium]
MTSLQSPVQGFEDVVGQASAVELLTQAIARNRIAPAYLFAGSEGIGKCLVAQRFAELLLARSKVGVGISTEGDRSPQAMRRLTLLRQRIEQGNHPDLFWVEPTYLHQGKRVSVSEAAELGMKRRSPPQIRLEQIREITQFLSRPSLESERAVVVLAAAATMAEPAANALLKTLEEPGQATLILLAPSVDSLLPTLVSRCQRISFTSLAPEEMQQVLERVEMTEILSQPQVMAIAQGSPGLAIESWQRLQAFDPELLTAVQRPLTSLRIALDLARQISKALDPEDQIWLIQYLQHLYWNQSYQARIIQQLETARKYLRSYVQPRLVWETTLMQMHRDQMKL